MPFPNRSDFIDANCCSAARRKCYCLIRWILDRTHTGNNNINNSIQEALPPKIDSFTYIAIGLAIAVFI